jgi:hypothetical protein
MAKFLQLIFFIGDIELRSAWKPMDAIISGGICDNLMQKNATSDHPNTDDIFLSALGWRFGVAVAIAVDAISINFCLKIGIETDGFSLCIPHNSLFGTILLCQ